MKNYKVTITCGNLCITMNNVPAKDYDEALTYGKIHAEIYLKQEIRDNYEVVIEAVETAYKKYANF